MRTALSGPPASARQQEAQPAHPAALLLATEAELTPGVREAIGGHACRRQRRGRKAGVLALVAVRVEQIAGDPFDATAQRRLHLSLPLLALARHHLLGAARRPEVLRHAQEAAGVGRRGDAEELEDGGEASTHV